MDKIKVILWGGKKKKKNSVTGRQVVTNLSPYAMKTMHMLKKL